MKSETQVRSELEQLKGDLEWWKEKFKKVDFSKPDAATKRMTLGNTISGVEGRIEALEWVLKEH